MSFTVKIKEEISNIKSTKSELIAEVSAYIKNNGVITLKNELYIREAKDNGAGKFSGEVPFESIESFLLCDERVILLDNSDLFLCKGLFMI